MITRKSKKSLSPLRKLLVEFSFFSIQEFLSLGEFFAFLFFTSNIEILVLDCDFEFYFLFE